MSNGIVEKEIIFSTITGSHSYGTAVSSSDIDTRGVAIRKDKGYYFGFLKKFEQQEDATKDDVIYDIRKFFNLAADNNPNILELLFIEEQFYKRTSSYWDNILENRDKFLSIRSRYSFVGYAYAQLHRIKVARNWLLDPPKNQPERSQFGLPERKLISADELGAFQWIMVHLLKDSIDMLNFSEATKKDLMEANWIGLIQKKGLSDEAIHAAQKLTGASDGWMEVMKKEQAYAHAKRNWDSYQKWKLNRNKKRAILEEKHGYDCKHAMHLVRLMRMGKEIISEQKVQVYRPDREELLDIRNGAWSFEQVEEYAKKMENDIVALSAQSKLPKEPDRVFLDNLCISTIEDYLSNGL